MLRWVLAERPLELPGSEWERSDEGGGANKAGMDERIIVRVRPQTCGGRGGGQAVGPEASTWPGHDAAQQAQPPFPPELSAGEGWNC